MIAKSNSRIQMFVLIGFCSLLFIQNFAIFSTHKLTVNDIKIEITSESDSESSEKNTEVEIEWDECSSHASYFIFFLRTLDFNFSFLKNYFSAFPADGIEFPPEF